jgi:hypothetical protein
MSSEHHHGLLVLPLPRQSCPHVLCMHEHDRSAPQRDPDRLSSGFASLIRERVQHRRFLDEDSNSGDTTVLSRYGAPLTTTLHARDSTRDPSRCFPKHFDRFANAMRIDGPLDSSKAHGGVAFPRRPQRRGAEDRRRSGSESHDAPSARVSPSSVRIESFGNDRPSACTALHVCTPATCMRFLARENHADAATPTAHSVARLALSRRRPQRLYSACPDASFPIASVFPATAVLLRMPPGSS